MRLNKIIIYITKVEKKEPVFFKKKEIIIH